MLTLTLALAGCSQASTSAAPTPSAIVAAELPAECPDIDLRSPSGSRVDLTGTWRGDNDAYWQFIQVGDCVWATATDFNFAHALRGRIRSDFFIEVEYAHLAGTGPSNARALPLGLGYATLQIEFADESMTMRKVIGCRYPPGQETDTLPGEVCPDGEVPLNTTLWTRVSEIPIFPPPTPGH